MLRTLVLAAGAMLLLGACEQNQPTAAAPAPTAMSLAPTAAPQTYAVFFDTGRSTLSAQSMNTIRQAAGMYKTGGGGVTLTGHTDTTGGQDENMQLSQRRVESVRSALVREGVPDSAITASATGETSLPVQTADNVSEQRNRSVVISFAAMRQMSDADYCAALSARYRQYRTSQIDEEAARAMGECTTNPAAAIPILVKNLTDAKIPLPQRA
jgi:outer membrane protein OmpA-like peptidoglycan-associated protein